MSETTREPKPERQWYQFHLRHLFVLTTVVAVVCSGFAVHPVVGVAVISVLIILAFSDKSGEKPSRPPFGPLGWLAASIYFGEYILTQFVRLAYRIIERSLDKVDGNRSENE